MAVNFKKRGAISSGKKRLKSSLKIKANSLKTFPNKIPKGIMLLNCIIAKGIL